MMGPPTGGLYSNYLKFTVLESSALQFKHLFSASGVTRAPPPPTPGRDISEESGAGSGGSHAYPGPGRRDPPSRRESRDHYDSTDNRDSDSSGDTRYPGVGRRHRHGSPGPGVVTTDKRPDWQTGATGAAQTERTTGGILGAEGTRNGGPAGDRGSGTTEATTTGGGTRIGGGGRRRRMTGGHIGAETGAGTSRGSPGTGMRRTDTACMMMRTGAHTGEDTAGPPPDRAPSPTMTRTRASDSGT